MKKQVVIIHGGTSFKTQKDYISYLKTAKMDIVGLKSRGDWKNSLSKQLGKNYEVLLPRMPNGKNAKYKEWELWFGRIAPLLNREVILIGHSLGGMFLVKYLAKNIFPKKIITTILVAAPYYDGPSKNEPFINLANFKLPKSLANFKKQSKNIYLIYSKDDPMVSLSHTREYKNQLLGAIEIIFKNKGHFNQENFPELVKLIKKQ